MSACTCASLTNQRNSLPLPTCHLHSLCVDAPEEGPEEAMRGGGLLVLGTAQAPHRPLASASASSLSCLSLCRSHGLPAEQPASQLGNEAPRTGPGAPGIHTGTLGAHFKYTLKTTKIFNLLYFQSCSERAPRIIK